MRRLFSIVSTLLFAIMLAGLVSGVQAAEKKVKVFILAGQSNMEGHGQIRSLDILGRHPKYGHLLKKLKNPDGSWAVRKDVTIAWTSKDKKSGPLTVGWGYRENEIGPELMFGTIMGEKYDQPVLLIKTAWGGKDVYCDFRSPSAGKPSGDEAAIIEKQRKENRNREIGFYYRKMVSEIKDCLANIDEVVPGYNGEGYEIAGMAWFQGWNDFCQWHLHVDGKRVGPGIIKNYTHNLSAMFHDLRKDLDVPEMPIVIGEMGVGGHEMTKRAENPDDHEAVAMVQFRKAQEAVAYDKSLKNVFVPTTDFWDTRLQELRVISDRYWNEKRKKGIKNTEENHLPTKELNDEYLSRGGHWYCHYNGSAANYSLVGYALAGALDVETDLAMTPPMGWNSWNAFEKEIDEKKIMAIADAMVSTGMRDAGYTYLVLDDAWMASERDRDGRLVADPEKFPSGMKWIGDYIHSKGLKYGIYQDRGKMTCQQLPGSLGHERIDMETFAEWGVDYIKLDSCFAESNGRMSSEDYAIYRSCIQSTGRPIVLSISDFGNAAWAWGGRESAQLWRTSNDIYPWMGSVYACAETSAGNRAIHPAFNGLWQFAGPGHWNDPDMLHVGNLKHIENERKDIADRAHFSLWCILAAPLMAGNDLRTMNKNVQDVLTAPELIAVNQDRRGVQGYKVFNDGRREVYNKPLSDGTTAVLLLNKGREKTDITVKWDQIGLSDDQPVRDLWAREDLGEFKDSFTAGDLGLHEHRMIKVGRPGPPLPTPAPMPPEKYTVTREGETYLSDLYYIWKAGNAPVYDATFGGEPIRVAGQTFSKGIGAKGKCAVMFKVAGRADRFRAIVTISKSSKEDAEGRFRVYNEDFFANKVLWDSGKMTKNSPAQEIDIELNDVQCLMLVFDGKNVFGSWADARVINESEND